MGLSLDEIRRNCKNARGAMARARAQRYALGAFNADNQETILAIARAAAKFKAPLMVEITEGEVDAMGLLNIRDMVTNYNQEYGTEIYLNLDHSPSVEDAIAGIEAGFEFIHIDISQKNHNASDKEIIEATSYIVEKAKLTGAVVESEAHYFGGSSNLHKEAIDYEDVRKMNSTPKGVRKFVAETGVDTYAVAIGNLHGKYPVPKILDLDLLSQIRAAVDCNLSLHGGSGTPGHFYEGAIKLGISKINVNSDMRYAYRKTLEKVLAENPDEYAIIKINQEVYDAVQRVVESKLLYYNAAGKAEV